MIMDVRFTRATMPLGGNGDRGTAWDAAVELQLGKLADPLGMV